MRLLQVMGSVNLLFNSFQGEIENVLGYVNKKQISSSMIAIHCHDTFGQALANILMALEVIIYFGVYTYVAS